MAGPGKVCWRKGPARARSRPRLQGQWVRERAYFARWVDAARAEEPTLVDARFTSRKARHGGSRHGRERGGCETDGAGAGGGGQFPAAGRLRAVWLQVLGHAYAAALGLLCFLEVGVATLDLTRALLAHGINAQRGKGHVREVLLELAASGGSGELRSPPLAAVALALAGRSAWVNAVGLAVFAGSYSLVIVLLFEPPLAPKARGGAFRAAHKAALLVTTWMAFLLPTDLAPALRGDSPGRFALRLGPAFRQLYLPVVLGLWAAVHVAWPVAGGRVRAAAKRRAEAAGRAAAEAGEGDGGGGGGGGGEGKGVVAAGGAPGPDKGLGVAVLDGRDAV